MSRSFLTSVASGYATVVVQAVTGVLLVPFLLSTHGVGLHGFGQIATIQALAAALSVLLDGHRQHASRQIALAATEQQPSRLPTLIIATAITCTLISGVCLLVAPALIDLVHIESADGVTAWRLAASCFVFEQLCYLLESHLHSARRSALANGLGALDAVSLALLTVFLFWFFGPAIHWFFLAGLLSLACKFLLLMTLSGAAFKDKPTVQALREESWMMVRSSPLALNGVAPFLIFRLTVILGNKYLGSEQAGVLSIMLVTLRTYLQQAVFSAMRPILISRLAGRGWAEQSSSDRQLFLTRLRWFQIGMFALGGMLAAATPVWLPLWLGAGLRPYAGYFATLMLLFAAEVAFGIPYYWLVANGRAHRLAVLNGAIGAITSAAVVLAAWRSGPLAVYVGAVAVYLLVYITGVRFEFRRWFGVTEPSH